MDTFTTISPEAPWSTPAVATAVAALFAGFSDPSADDIVDGVLAVLNAHGYDSVDREMAFTEAEARFGVPYEDLYRTWLNGEVDR